MNSKKKIAFNLVDLILLMAILASSVTLVYFLTERKIVVSDDAVEQEIEYKLEVPVMREEFKNLIQVGQTLTESSSSANLGEVVDISYSGCNYTGTDLSSGNPVSSAYPGMITMVLTVKTNAVITRTGYLTDGFDLVLGGQISFRSPSLTQCAKCTAITASAGENQ